MEVNRIYDENPDPTGQNVIGVEYSRRASTTLVELGFIEGITPKLAAKVVFAVEPTLIKAFSNGPGGGNSSSCRPGN